MRRNSVKRRAAGAAALLAVAVGIAHAIGGAATQQAKLTAGDGAAGDYFGWSVALAGDTAVVGALLKDVQRGAAYVFTRTGTTWGQQVKLTTGDPADSDRFGISVALSGDTAVVGTGGNEAAWVFTRTGTTWTRDQRLTAGDPATGDHFGYSVAVSGDTAVVGAYGQSAFRGAAYVFTRTGSTWTQQAKLVAVDPASNDYFGQTVAIAGDSVAVGAPEKDAFRGAVYVFARTGTTWTQQAKLTSADAADGDFLGISVAMAGETIVTGAYAKASARGAAYVFARTGTTWTEQASLTPADVADGDQFGVSVALSGDTAVVGNATRSSVPSAVYVFTRAGGTWVQASRITAADAEVGDGFGSSVAVAGATVVAGAGAKNSGQGAAYVFAGLAPPPAGYCLATKVKARANIRRARTSTLTASGALDTGIGAPDFTGPATFDVGGFHLVVPAFVAKGKSLVYGADGMALTITPAKNGSSHAVFSVKVVGDFTGKIGRDSPLALRFTNAAHDVTGTANLTAGALGPHGVTAPNLSVLGAAATIKGGGNDALKLTIGFASDGVVPVAPEDLTICFGGTYTSELGSGWVQKGNAWVRTAKAPGITKATVDHVKGTITIAGSGLDLGAFAAAGNAVVVTIRRGSDARSVGVRMVRAGAKLAY